MRQDGHVVWLTARPATILARMTADATTADRRPSLTNRPPLEEIVQLLERREPVYRQAAHRIVDTEGKSPEALVEEILRTFAESRNVSTDPASCRHTPFLPWRGT
jgi:shikimate kinase